MMPARKATMSDAVRVTMKLPELKGSPKQVQWAAKIRTERLRVWSESSPERFRAIEERVATLTDAGWWISYRDKDCATVYHHLLEGVDLRKIEHDEWRRQEKRQEQKERAEARAYLKQELKKEADGGRGSRSVPPTRAVSGNGLLKWEGPAVDIRTGSVCSDPDLPF